MNRRVRQGLAICALLLCGSCAIVTPQATAAIAPATFTDLWIGLAADFENWLLILGI